MPISNVGVNPNLQSETKDKTSVVKGTAIAGVVGAGIYAGADYGLQKYTLKNADKFTKMAQDNLNFLKENVGSFSAKAREYLIKSQEKIINFIKKGKIDIKSSLKAAGIGAAVFAGIYLAYRGIKSLFTKNN